MRHEEIKAALHEAHLLHLGWAERQGRFDDPFPPEECGNCAMYAEWCEAMITGAVEGAMDRVLDQVEDELDEVQKVLIRTVGREAGSRVAGMEQAHLVVRGMRERVGGRVAGKSEPDGVSPGASGAAGSRERLDPLAATRPRPPFAGCQADT